jgi:hypothetical protein
MAEENTANGPGTEVEDLAQGYPDLTQVFAAIPQQDDVRTTGVRRLEVNCFASGDATFNIFYVEQEEPVGGYITDV